MAFAQTLGMGGLCLGIGLLVVLIWAISTHNRFVSLEAMLKESWANVDIQLKRRYDLIPNLVEATKGYAEHEQALFVRLAEAREKAMNHSARLAEVARDEENLGLVLGQLVARIEAYPELKANTNFVALQQELANTEDRIAAARRLFNANVRDFNTLLEQFPSNLLRGSRQPREFFEIEDPRQRAVPSAKT